MLSNRAMEIGTRRARLHFKVKRETLLTMWIESCLLLRLPQEVLMGTTSFNRNCMCEHLVLIE